MMMMIIIIPIYKQQLHTYGSPMYSYLPYYFECKKRLLLFTCFSKLKIMACLKIEVSFLTLPKCREHYFPRKTNGFAQKVVNFKESKLKQKISLKPPLQKRSASKN